MVDNSHAMVCECIESRINGARLVHAYIISGADEAERRAAAEYIAKTAVCTMGGERPCLRCRNCNKSDKGVHPDITFVEKEKDAKELTVDAARALRAASATLPNEAERSVYIICDGDNMNTQAQNAVLKLLEEPPAHVIFVLLAENPERLLPTVRSRCELVCIPPLPVEKTEKKAEQILLLWEKRDELGILKEINNVSGLDREVLRTLAGGMTRRIVSRLREGNSPRADRDLLGIQETLTKAEKYLDANVSAGNVSGMLLAEFLSD